MGCVFPGYPGRSALVGGFATMNKKGGSGWGVCLGSRYYPDYVVPDTGGRAGGGGRMLTADEAEQLAAELVQVAGWARAQNHLDDHA